MRGPDKRATSFARRLRKGATDAERRLWSRLRNRQVGGCKFVRQEPIGDYIADFCCREARLVVEADGGQHAESMHDVRRDAWLVNQGYRVLRFWNHDVLTRTDDIIDTIYAALAERGAAASPDPPPPA